MEFSRTRLANGISVFFRKKSGENVQSVYNYQFNKLYNSLHIGGQVENIALSKVRSEINKIVNRVAYGKERICLTYHGKKMAVIVPLEDIKDLESTENSNEITKKLEKIGEDQ